MKKYFFTFFSIFLFNTIGFTQILKTSNIHYTIIDNKIAIFYDLPVNYDSLKVTVVFYKNSDSKFIYYPKYISGEVGVGKFSGKNKKITWYWKKEPSYLFTGSGYYFKINATKIQKKITENEVTITQSPILIDTIFIDKKPEVNTDSILLADLKKEQEKLQKENDSLAQLNKKLIEEQKILNQKKEDSIMQANKKLQELKDLETLKNQQQKAKSQKVIKVPDTSNAAPVFNVFAGYGTHGIVAGFNYKIITTEKIKSATRIYINFGLQNYTFQKPITFNGLDYNSDTRIVSYGAGAEQEFYLKRWFHLAPFAGFRFDNAHFINNFINDKIGEGELIRYVDGYEVGSRLNKDYGVTGLMIDIGGCVNLKLTKHFWLIGKIALSPVKYNSNRTIYGKYWADTPQLNDYAIKRSIVRGEVALSFGF